MFEGDSIGSLNTLWMLQKCSLNLMIHQSPQLFAHGIV